MAIYSALVEIKETTLERADFTLQMLKFVTAEKEGEMFIFFFLSISCQLLSLRFYTKAGVQITNDHTIRPRRQLSNVVF